MFRHFGYHFGELFWEAMAPSAGAMARRPGVMARRPGVMARRLGVMDLYEFPKKSMIFIENL